MGNLSGGVNSASVNVVARWPARKSFAEIQSLVARPALSRGVLRAGIAKAPNAATGASLSSSRRLILRNVRRSVRVIIYVSRSTDPQRGRIRLRLESFALG